MLPSLVAASCLGPAGYRFSRHRATTVGRRSLRGAGAGSTVHSRTATSSVGAVAFTSAAASSVGAVCLLRAAALWCLARRRIIVFATAVRPNPAFNTDAPWAALRARPPVAG